MSKVYGIFCDKNLDSVLVGTGGTSGEGGKKRTGWHLPGGTIEGNLFSAKSATVPLIMLHGHLARELEEEFGKVRAKSLDPYISKSLSRIGLPLGGYNVYFVICRVMDSMFKRYEGLVQDGSGSAADSSFDRVRAVGLLDALDMCRSDPTTDWFASGIKHVVKHKATLMA